LKREKFQNAEALQLKTTPSIAPCGTVFPSLGRIGIASPTPASASNRHGFLPRSSRAGVSPVPFGRLARTLVPPLSTHHQVNQLRLSLQPPAPPAHIALPSENPPIYTALAQHLHSACPAFTQCSRVIYTAKCCIYTVIFSQHYRLNHLPSTRCPSMTSRQPFFEPQPALPAAGRDQNWPSAPFPSFLKKQSLSGATRGATAWLPLLLSRCSLRPRWAL